ncbi:hypothetical protein DFR67_114166 [Williamsia limnetica]|uniref:Uncharacterized protein n=1 Tax=Williamsia limnetica TaxID=882452 RepID=A0A318RWE7_WILLI|nr:hypothetical protein [Williamsia limnetica]PYE14067.1 hypothetical protein DFR67_114166 [Williamsia limnetica]
MAKSRAKKPPPTKPPTPAVARQVFSELNATFYTADPGEFLTMRVEALSLMAAPDEALAASFGSERTIGATQFGSMPVPDAEARQRYIQTEAVIIFHHAAELVLRLFFAHTERETCPWFAMAASTSFADFKDKVAKSLDAGFDRVEIAMVFLGGTDPKDAAIGATEEEFSETVEAIRQLLHFAAYRLLKESFLYNASKHGLTAVQL